MTVCTARPHEWRRAFLATPKTGELTTARVAVALAASSYADGATGSDVRPAQDTLAAAVGVNRTTVGRALRALVEAGWLAVTDTPHARPVVYRLTVPQPYAPVHGAAVHGARVHMAATPVAERAPVHQDQSSGSTSTSTSGTTST